MSLTLSKELMEATGVQRLLTLAQNAFHHRADREVSIDISKTTDNELREIIRAANELQDGKTSRASEAILKARAGSFGHPIPNFKAFEEVLRQFLLHNLIDGWIYARGEDGKLYPELVTSIHYEPGNQREKQSPRIKVHTTYYGKTDRDRATQRVGVMKETYTFDPHDVTKRRIADALAESGLYAETEALKAEYMGSMERHAKVTSTGFAKQFRLNGVPFHFESDHYRKRGTSHSNRRVIHDLDGDAYAAVENHAESELFIATTEGTGFIPEHPVIRLFDLKTHEFYWAHSDFLSPHQYDKTLRHKLVLPASHRDLLDVLTTDLDAFTSDFIEGKSAGNIILCKGIPGVGKTATAEAYSELIDRPLYSIHSGHLGSTASQIAENLQQLFQRAKRWSCVMLLDEADVFVLRRGDNILQNAIVAEFLRALEYMDVLLFLTTNRPDDIDDAIISRAAAIIEYHVPPPEDAAAIWRVMAAQFEVTIEDDLIRSLISSFPKIAPRDIKMLLRLALRVSRKHDEPLTIDVFRRCAMFRAIEIAQQVNA